MARTIAFAFVTAVAFLSPASGGYSQENALESRIKIMKTNSADNKALNAAVAKEDFATVEAKPKDLVSNFDKLTELFPEGSASDKSRAKPEIWET